MNNIIINLKDFMLSDNGMELLGFIVTIGVAYTTAKLTSKNTKKSFTTQYFKEKGITVQEKVLKFWTALILNNFNIKKTYYEVNDVENKKNDADDVDDVGILLEMQKDSYIYCSPKTIKALSDYQQYLYKNKDDDKIKENDIKEKNKDKAEKSKFEIIKRRIKFYRMFILITRIISGMKYDFTDEKVDELDIIKLKITDFDLLSRILCKIMVWYYNFKNLLIKLGITLILLLIVLCIF